MLDLAAMVLRRFRLSRASEHERIRFFRLGSVGDRIRLTGTVDFGSEPYLIHLGSDITIADRVVFLTHDGGVGLFRDDRPGLEILARIVVHDRVFIGHGVIVLPGVTLGPDVVIGAGSVVTRDVPPGTVAAGNPCRHLATLAEYREKSFTKSVVITARTGAARRAEIESKVTKAPIDGLQPRRDL